MVVQGRFTAWTEWMDSAGHCYTAGLRITGLQREDGGEFALQLDNTEGGIQRRRAPPISINQTYMTANRSEY